MSQFKKSRVGHRVVDGVAMLVNVNSYNQAEFEIIEPLQIVYSPTGESHGSGSDPYRWVSQLTSEERELVRAGHIVVIDKYVSARAPLPIQVVIYKKGRYDHRVPDFEIMDDCLVAAGYDPAEW